jgi:membrane protease YdiL (CAAX protease family)
LHEYKNVKIAILYYEDRREWCLRKISYELLTLPLPFVLWFITFKIPIIGFWLTITVSTSILLITSIPRWGEIDFKFSLKDVTIGLLSGIFLYAFFWSGFQIAKSIPGFTQTISSVYALRGEAPLIQIAEVLLFPISPAEELYWRGLIQRYLVRVIQPSRGLIVTSILYSVIHLPTLNPSLMLVALIAGLVWGYLFNRLGKIIPVIVSHIVFNEMVFVLLVIS